MTTSFDAIVIGAGVAGLTAAAIVARGGLRCLCIDRMGPGGLLINLGALVDCPDLPAGTSGPDHVASLTDDAMGAGAELAIGEVQSLRPGDVWTVQTESESFTARAVIVATGLGNGRLGIDDEARFEGQGLSHCAACDGPLYAGADVMVAGADRWALQEAIELAETAGRTTVVTGTATLDTADPRIRHLTSLPNVAVLPGRILGLQGEDGLQSVVLDQGGRQAAVPVRGLFVYTDRRPATDFAGDLVTRDEGLRIRVDENQRAGASLLYAAGDVRAGAVQSVAEAAADGRRAGQAVLGALAG
ncbi:NAD(P)/FAD-dependent oxidoreductase [Desertibaculum subflavum]|uniref:NAD(P)/FAD-dependent oxidoreductase n=1 Tax=Desertibaculum subflavum TaxID=2268458 RepID=UPI0013C3E4E6